MAGAVIHWFLFQIYKFKNNIFQIVKRKGKKKVIQFTLAVIELSQRNRSLYITFKQTTF